MRVRRNGLSTLSAAIEWLSGAWDDRDTPRRLHDRYLDDGGTPRYAPAFATHMAAKPDDRWYPRRGCLHKGLLPNADVSLCPECHGAGSVATDYMEYRWPMWRALTLMQRKHPASYDVVLTLVVNAYSVRDMVHLGYGEGAVLTAIRRLFDCYERAPVRVPYSDKSEAQQVAERRYPEVASATS